MEFRFTIRQFTSPLPSRNNQTALLPLVWLNLVSRESGTGRWYRCLLDSGSDETLFFPSQAADLGIDLTKAPTRNKPRPGGVTISLAYADVSLRLSDTHGTEVYEWTAGVAFGNAGLGYPVLGFAGCLEFFNAFFLSGNGVFSVFPHQRLPVKVTRRP